MKLAHAIWLGFVVIGAAAQDAPPQKSLVGVGIDIVNHRDEPAEPLIQEWRVRAMAADGSGMVWAIAGPCDASEQSSYSGAFKNLAIFDHPSSQWKAHPISMMPSEAYPDKMVALSKGKVACLWRSGEECVLTLHEKGKDQLWCSLKANFNEPRLLALSDGGLAITERGPQVARISADGKNPTIERLPDELMLRPAKSEDGRRSYATVHAVEADAGSLWLWSYMMQKQDHTWRIPGFLRWADGAIEPLRPQPFDDGILMSSVINDGEEGIYAAGAGAGMIRMLPADSKTQKFNAPRGVLRYIEKLAVVDSSLLIITCPQPDDMEVGMSSTLQNHLEIKTQHHYDVTRKTGTLWRVDNRRLGALIEGVDASPRFGWVERPLLATDKGLLMGANQGGLWWIPKAAGAKGYLLDSSQGFSLQTPTHLCAIGDDAVLALAEDGGWKLFKLPGDKPTQVESRIASLRTGRIILQDSRLHLWALRGEEKDVAEWDGKAWHKRDLPEDLDSPKVIDFASDSHDQGWWVPTDGGKTSVLNFADGSWRVFDSLEDAVAACLANGDHITMPRYISFSAISHQNGNKGFLCYDGTVHVAYDGKWAKTDIHEIGGPDVRVSGKPFFGGDGLFCLPLGGKHFKLRKDGKWEEVPDADTSSDRTYLSDDSTPPPGCPVKNISSTCYDRHGVAWLVTHDGALWKWLPGVAVQVKDHDRPVLLRPHSRVAEVLIDPQRNAFLRYSNGNELVPYEMLKAKAVPAIKRSQLARVEASSAFFELDPTPGLWHRWRMDQGNWQPPENRAELKLEGLLPGEHHLEIATFDEELNPVSASERLSFTITALAGGLVQAQIAQLKSGDLETQEATAKLLKAQGVNALPALKIALQQDSDESVRWWIAAIIQHIERQAHEGGRSEAGEGRR